LKPDNVGFTADGTLKLFDFGLVTCVRARESPSDAYHMTGNTGSLRYMAPEVALREPYSEKVDVYSFGIMLWQMAKDSIPFTGLNKTEFMQEVVRGDVRPKPDRAWPAEFSDLLTSCWHRNPERRPSFAVVLAELHSLSSMQPNGSALALGGVASPVRDRLLNVISKDKKTAWF
jgi:serine/threonine protein kinase